ncbi:MAG: EscU/YscU/HrcU family type III secretion system export apparatus switch protein [Spirochaetes bacterium]|nr:EscU/YscU/HrcU family type III secretion system export apparatus switch protein [Spirochaetota bacterium]
MKKRALVIKYNKEEFGPKILIKGEELLAKKILEKAKEYGILIVEDKEKLQILWNGVEEGEIIPEDLWEILVDIYRFVIKFNRNFLKEVFYESKGKGE